MTKTKKLFLKRQYLDQQEVIDTNDALLLLKKETNSTISRKTLLRWIEKYKLGKKLGGRWRVFKTPFIEFIKGSG